MIRKILIAAKGLSLMLCCVLLTVFSQGSRESAANGIKLCLNVLVPSLFPFMALTNLFAQTGLCQKLGKPLNKLTQKLLGLSGAAAPVILMSLIGGYPVGAAGIAQLRRQNALSGAEAEQAALFAVCAGPGFVISFAGAGLFGSVNIGLIIFAAQAISVLLTAALTHIELRLLPQKEAVFSTSHIDRAAVFGGSVLSGAALIGVTICFLASVKQAIKKQ